MGFQCRPHVARRQDAAAVTAARKAREGSVAAIDRDGTAHQLRAAERQDGGGDGAAASGPDTEVMDGLRRPLGGGQICTTTALTFIDM